MRTLDVIGKADTLTADKLLLSAAKFNCGGLRIFVSEHVRPEPVLQVDPKLEWITPGQRARTNAALLELFGTREVAYMFGRDVFVNSKAAAILRL